MPQLEQLSDAEIEAGHSAITFAITEMNRLADKAEGQEREYLRGIARALDTAGRQFKKIYSHKTFTT